MSRWSDDEDVGTFSMPSASVDLVWMVLFAMLAAEPQFLNHIRLPSLVTHMAQALSAPGVGKDVVAVDLLKDGTLRLQGRPIDREQLVNELGSPTLSAKAISLRVDSEDGQGPLTELLQLQASLAEAKLISRVRLAIKQNNEARP